jgi:succinate--hydroxymethylglutarate CoA-transferase
MHWRLGYGQTGPNAKKAGYDVMVEGEFGLMYITGEQTGPPVKVGVAVTDLTTGMYSHGAILAALFSRTKTGKGQHLDMCLADSQVATLTNVASSELISNFETQSRRWGTAHPSIVPYRAFKTKDSYFLIGGGNDRLFGVIAESLGCPEWTKDKRWEWRYKKADYRFATNSSRVANRDVLEVLIENITQSKITDDWAKIFGDSGVPHAKIK